MFPFLATVEGKSLSSRAYGISLFTHTRNRALGRESFGFPWPLSVYEREIPSGRTRTLRFFPFYQGKGWQGGTSRFLAWPLLRQKRSDSDNHHYRRTDLLLALVRDQEERGKDPMRRRSLFTLFPLYRAWSDGTRSSAGAPALLDSLFPTNQVVLDLYAPLWQLWTRERSGEGEEWTILWGAGARRRGRIEYPWHWR